ncbi:MAG: MFS transporter [Pseudobutyrivibrio sp.]|nr:MFS transporter [Pseudobutyrivibrio sp.]
MTDITTTTNTNTPRQTDTLWTRDFTIITIGSVISMLGNSLTSFAMSLMVLDYTNSSMLYAIYMVLYTLPQLVTPIISGAILDRFSRKKMIYTLDFVSAGIYLTMAITLLNGVFNFPMFAAVIFILGIIQSTYYIAYDSLYPMLITEGYYQKAYSISSMLETMTVVMVPVSTFVYKLVGIGPLMIINAVSFAIAAVFEMQIGHEEKYVEKRKNEVDNSRSKINQMLIDIKEGVKYMRSEPALLAIVSYFGLNMLACGAMDVLCLPYYKQNFKNGEYLYALVFGMSFIGRAVGGGIHYKFKIPTKLKFMFAMTIYIIIAIGEGTYMFMPIGLAVVVCFITGISGVTSYTIRISSTQSYVPDEKKGRYNGTFQLITTIGLVIGQMAGGALAQKMDARFVVFAGNIIALIAAIIIIGGNRKAVAKIYNTDN